MLVTNVSHTWFANIYRIELKDIVQGHIVAQSSSNKIIIFIHNK